MFVEITSNTFNETCLEQWPGLEGLDERHKTTLKGDFAPFVNYVVDMMAAFEGCTHSGGKGKKLRKASKRPARSLKNYSTCSS